MLVIGVVWNWLWLVDCTDLLQRLIWVSGVVYFVVWVWM